MLALRNPTMVPTAQISSNICDVILSGEIDAAKGGVILKQMEEAIETARKNPQVKNAIIEATKRYIEKGKTADILGYKVTVGIVSTVYDFEAAGHPELNAWYKLQAHAKARIKVLEDELKAFSKETDAKWEKVNKTKVEAGQPVGIMAPGKKTVITENVPEMEFNDNGDLVGLKLVSSGEIAEISTPPKFTVEGLKYSEKDKKGATETDAPPFN